MFIHWTKLGQATKGDIAQIVLENAYLGLMEMGVLFYSFMQPYISLKFVIDEFSMSLEWQYLILGLEGCILYLLNRITAICMRIFVEHQTSIKISNIYLFFWQNLIVF